MKIVKNTFKCELEIITAKCQLVYYLIYPRLSFCDISDSNKGFNIIVRNTIGLDVIIFQSIQILYSGLGFEPLNVKVKRTLQGSQ